MTWSIRARLTAWHSLVVVLVVATGAISVAFVQQRLALKRLDGEIQRLMLTLEGVMRTEFNEGLDLQGAADEASSEVVAPDRTLMLTRTDGSSWRSGVSRSRQTGGLSPTFQLWRLSHWDRHVSDS